MTDLWTLTRGDGPVIVNVPHAGTHVPASIGATLTLDARTLPDTDWHVEKLCAFAAQTGATLMCATHSRYVVDLNRDPSGAALYAGADNTEICPTRTFANAPVYMPGTEPSSDDVGARVAACFLPYHAALAAQIERVRARHGYAVLLDAHSIPAEVPRFFDGRLPDLNLERPTARVARQNCKRRRQLCSRTRPASPTWSTAVSRVAGSPAATGDRRSARTRCNWKSRNAATWTKRRRIRGTQPVRRRSRPCCDSWSACSTAGGRQNGAADTMTASRP